MIRFFRITIFWLGENLGGAYSQPKNFLKVPSIAFFFENLIISLWRGLEILGPIQKDTPERVSALSLNYVENGCTSYVKISGQIFQFTMIRSGENLGVTPSRIWIRSLVGKGLQEDSDGPGFNK